MRCLDFSKVLPVPQVLPEVSHVLYVVPGTSSGFPCTECCPWYCQRFPLYCMLSQVLPEVFPLLHVVPCCSLMSSWYCLSVPGVVWFVGILSGTTVELSPGLSHVLPAFSNVLPALASDVVQGLLQQVLSAEATWKEWELLLQELIEICDIARIGTYRELKARMEAFSGRGAGPIVRSALSVIATGRQSPDSGRPPAPWLPCLAMVYAELGLPSQDADAEHRPGPSARFFAQQAVIGVRFHCHASGLSARICFSRGFFPGALNFRGKGIRNSFTALYLESSRFGNGRKSIKVSGKGRK